MYLLGKRENVTNNSEGELGPRQQAKEKMLLIIVKGSSGNNELLATFLP